MKANKLYSQNIELFLIWSTGGMLGDKVIRRKYDVSNKCVQNLNELYNLYSERHPLSLDPRFKCGKKKKTFKQGKKMLEETSGRTLSQGGQTCNRCRMYRKEQQNHSLQVALTEYLIQRWASWLNYREIPLVTLWDLKNVAWDSSITCKLAPASPEEV